MIILNETDNSVEVDLTAAVTTNQLQVYSAFIDTTEAATTPGKTDTVTNNTTAVTAVAAPAASTQRIVKSMSIYNADTAEAEVTVQFNNNATLTTLFKGLLQPGEMLCYVDGQGFFTRNPFGGVGTGVVPGRLIRAPRILTSGTTYTRPNGVTSLVVQLWGAGGGGGGVDGQGTGCAAGGGGGAGGYALKRYTNPPATCTYAIGALGAGGVAGNNNGSNGGDTTFTDGTTLVTAKGGSGGTGMLGATTSGTLAAGGAGGVVSTNGDINGAGQAGLPGLRFATAQWTSGMGGHGPGGGGGGTPITNAGANGNAGNGQGSGGSGAGVGAVATNFAGGDGAPGLIIIEEYA
jgi:hypothetical protein